MHQLRSPRACKRDLRRPKSLSIDHQQQYTIADEVAGDWNECEGKLCWTLEEDFVLKTIIADEHHCAGNTDSNARSHERIQSRPCEVSGT